MSAESDPSLQWPLHWAIWHKDISSLKKEIAKISVADREVSLKYPICYITHLNPRVQSKLEEKDPRGRSPLLLAATLGYWDIVKYLAEEGASLSSDDKSGFNVFHETVTAGDTELVSEMMYRRDLQRFTSRIDSIPQLLQRIKDVSI